MVSTDRVAAHYSQGGLLPDILDGVRRMGKSPETVNVDDLGPVDEFHIGGRTATEMFLDQLEIAAQDVVLDVGCGLGGASRFAARRYGCQVRGIDLTDEYVTIGNVLSSWVGLSDLITLEKGDATATPYPDRAFDRSYMMHVGMNIADKQALASELYRVLRPGGRLGIYDVMRVGDGALQFPVPWATNPEESAVASPGEYRDALESAGFRVISQCDRSAFALEFFSHLRERTDEAESAPLGLHVLMGDAAPQKVRNMIENVSRRLVAPVEIIVEKAA
jgi:ubiquinone/menaquinone biosynthesis C-methylase UbiE